MEYRKEQLLNQQAVYDYFIRAGEREQESLRDRCREYFQFRAEVEHFQSKYFQSLCTSECFQNQLSACCNKDGIITFFADMAINAAVSSASEMEDILSSLRVPRTDMKCIYLSPQGCRWRLKPIVCQMFLCDRAEEEVFSNNPGTMDQWHQFKARERLFRWPDRPVLFDEIESRFLAAGVRSSLMYLHNSPGLIRIKKMAGLI